GYAYARASPNVADVAEEALAFTARPGDVPIRVARWPAEGPGGLTTEIEGAALFARTENVVAIVGHSGSRESLLGATVYNEAGIPHIVPTSTSRRLADAGPWTFRLAPNDSVEGDVLAAFIVDSLHLRSATIFYFADEYGAGLREGVVSGLKRRGGVVADEVMTPPVGSCPPMSERDDFEVPVEASLRRGMPQVIVLAGRRVDGGCIMRRVHAAHPELPFVAGDGIEAASPALAGAVGRALSRLSAVVFWLSDSDDSLSISFRERFRRIVGRDPDDSDAMVYDAFLVLGRAVREGGPTRLAVRRWLESLGRTRDPFRGVTGRIGFTHERRRALHLVRPAGPVPPE
ncbi:MAG: ABC transporter substrate-binding protein, partial [Gemmatimonadales bacterium]